MKVMEVEDALIVQAKEQSDSLELQSSASQQLEDVIFCPAPFTCQFTHNHLLKTKNLQNLPKVGSSLYEVNGKKNP